MSALYLTAQPKRFAGPWNEPSTRLSQKSRYILVYFRPLNTRDSIASRTLGNSNMCTLLGGLREIGEKFFSVIVIVDIYLDRHN